MTERSVALAVRQELTPQVWQMIMEIAPVIYKSRMFGSSSIEGAAAIMLKGYDLGLSRTASFEFIHNVMGKPELAPRGALALLHASPEIKEIKIERITDAKGVYTGHTCTMTRRNGFTYTTRWTLADAERAGLVKDGSGWKTYPENMCMWRAVGFCADVVAPDICAGSTNLMKMPERYGVGLSEGGDIIEGTWTTAPTTEQVDDKITLADLVQRFGADAVMTANGGQIPSTDVEIAAVAAVLEAGA